MTKKILSFLLIICMIMQLAPFSVLADSEAELPFGDVKAGDWYYDSVAYVYEKGLMNGTSGSTFTPDGTLTRAMVVTVLWRLEGQPEPTAANPFTDMDTSGQTWYQDAVAWASENGIVNGYGGGLFGPMDDVTREQLATIMYRYAAWKGYDVTARADLSAFTDADEISDWAAEAMSWANAEKLIQGTSETTISAAAQAQRAQFAAIVYRFLEVAYPQEKDSDLVYFRVTLVSSENEPEFRYLPLGTQIISIPAPERTDGAIFTGWYYDEALTEAAVSADLLKEDVTLYAKYQEVPELQATEYNRILSATDQSPAFSVAITSQESLTPEELAKRIEVINATDPKEENFYTITGSGTSFLIQGSNGTFTPGSDYKILLNDESLSFTGHGTGETAPVEYDFSIHKDEVVNVRLRSGIKYVPIADVSGLIVNGEPTPAAELQVASVLLTGDGTATGIATAGSFAYAGSLDLKPGDIVGIYKTKSPADMTAEEIEAELILAEPDVSFIEITDVTGGTVQYRGAEATEVLFTPDVIPVPMAADQDGDPNNSSIKANESYFLFDDGALAAYGLDADTTVDVGDYLALYGADKLSDVTAATEVTYAVITGFGTPTVERDGVYWVVNYEVVTKAAMLASADTYYSRPVTTEEFDTMVDKDAVEKEAEMMVQSTGFADSAALYLAASLMSTQEFNDVMCANGIDPSKLEIPDTVTEADESLYVQSVDTGLSTMAVGPKVEVAITGIDAELGTKLAYYEGLKGVRLYLEVTVEVTVHSDAGADIKFTITGGFEQELRLTFGVNAKAEWDTSYLIPILKDYTVTVTTDIYEYSGFSIEITITLEQGKTPASHFKRLTKALNTASDAKETLGNLMESGSKIMETGEVMSFELAEKYTEMVQAAGELDWVDVFTIDLMKDSHMKVLYVIDISFGVDFVVSAKVNLTVGSQFTYAAAKRYVFTLKLFALEVTNESVDLEPEVYQYTFYAMGYIGIRAGIRLKLAIGLGSTKFDSVGIHARVGAYVEMWGYFYYLYRHEKMNGAVKITTKYAGALLFELGIFTNIAFVTQVGDNSLAFSLDLYDHQWPLLTMGEQKNVQDFAWDKDDVGELTMKYAFTRAYLPDNFLTIEYLDLKEGAKIIEKGDDTEYEFFTEPRPLSDFTIEITNPAFTYNKEHNCIDVDTSSGEMFLDGELIITYKKAPLTLTNKPIQRRIPLHWDKLADNYYIIFDTMGGSHIDMIEGKYGLEFDKPEDPVRKGYTFAGWYSDGLCKNPATIPDTIQAEGLVFYAKWTPAETTYTVEYYQKSLSGLYELVDSEICTAVTGTEVTPEGKTYEGFTLVGQKTAKVIADGSLRIQYFYSRNTYTATFYAGGTSPLSLVKTYQYDEPIAPPSFGLAGYGFSGWNAQVPERMPAENISFTGTWEPADDTQYKVRHMLQPADGGQYTVDAVEYLTGTTGTQTKAAAKDSYAGYTPEAITQLTIEPDGSTTVDVKYSRNTYTLTYDCAGGAIDSDVTETHRFGQTVFAPRPTRADYAFTGWYTDQACTASFDGIMPPEDLTLYAGWVKGTGYTVEHYYMDTNGRYPEKLTESDKDMCYVQESEEAGKFIAEFTVAPRAGKEGFTNPASVTVFTDSTSAPEGATVLDPNGNTVIRFEYVRHPHSLTLNWKDGTDPETTTVYYGTELDKTLKVADDKRPGYTFGGWYTDSAYTEESKLESPVTMPDSDLTVYAKWTPITYDYIYYLNDGTANPYDEGTYVYGNKLTKPEKDPERTGYDFMGWYSDAAGTEEYDWENPKPMGNKDIYAGWELHKYTITADYNGGKLDNKTGTTIPYYLTGNEPDQTGTDIQIAPPKYDNHVFDGWTFEPEIDQKYIRYDEKNSDQYLMILKGCTGDFKITAKWKGEARTVTFSDNASHYNNVDKANKPMILVDDIKNMPTSSAVTLEYGKAPCNIPNFTAPTSFGYDFDGWYLDSECRTLVYDKTGISQYKSEWTKDNGTTLYAKWTPKTYNIIFDKGNGDEVVSTMTGVKANATSVTLPKGSNTGGNQIIGWRAAPLNAYSTNGCKLDWVVGATITDDLVRSVNGSSAFGDITLYAVCIPNSYEYEVLYRMQTSLPTYTCEYDLGGETVTDKKVPALPVDDYADTSTVIIGFDWGADGMYYNSATFYKENGENREEVKPNTASFYDAQSGDIRRVIKPGDILNEVLGQNLSYIKVAFSVKVDMWAKNDAWAYISVYSINNNGGEAFRIGTGRKIDEDNEKANGGDNKALDLDAKGIYDFEKKFTAPMSLSDASGFKFVFEAGGDHDDMYLVNRIYLTLYFST